MAIQNFPTKFIVNTVIAGTTSPVDVINDTDSPYFGWPLTFQVSLLCQLQPHSSAETREPYAYTAYDVNEGDWLAQPSGKAYKIISIVQVDDDENVTVIISDENKHILKNDPTQGGNNYPDEDQYGAVFSLDEDGNPIFGGLSSQSGQFPNLGYWLHDIESMFELYSIDEEGVETYADWDQTVAQETDGDSAATGITIEYTPFQDSKVEVKVNGIVVNLGNGVKTKDCYFSNDGGATAKLIKDIEAGDELFWNETYAGYRLDPSDDIDFDYEASNLDLQ